jgi:hypothetical protein
MKPCSVFLCVEALVVLARDFIPKINSSKTIVHRGRLLGIATPGFSFDSVPGLPDGIFAYQKYQFENILGGVGIENEDTFYSYLMYYTYINLVYFYSH